MKRLAAALVLWLAAGAAALSLQPDEVLRDQALEARARAISAGLRCLVCQNQSIDDSDAPLARDLRLLVRERLTRGDNDDAVREFVVRRYGEFVLLRPPLSWHTALLWAGPGVLLLLGIGGLALVQRRRRATYAPLSAEEESALARMVRAPDTP